MKLFNLSNEIIGNNKILIIITEPIRITIILELIQNLMLIVTTKVTIIIIAHTDPESILVLKKVITEVINNHEGIDLITNIIKEEISEE